MRDEELVLSGFSTDTSEADVSSECEAAPPSPPAKVPLRGAALSVLWWIEGDAARTPS